MKHRETKWNSSASRFRKRIESLENENYELKESINLLEKERIQRWGKDDSKVPCDQFLRCCVGFKWV